MGYSITAEYMATALRGINDVIQKNNFNIHFPIECRYVKADNLWLSPSYKRDTAYIAIHMYKGMAFEHIFQAIEERKSTRLNSSHVAISYAVFCLKKKTK